MRVCGELFRNVGSMQKANRKACGIYSSLVTRWLRSIDMECLMLSVSLSEKLRVEEKLRGAFPPFSASLRLQSSDALPIPMRTLELSQAVEQASIPRRAASGMFTFSPTLPSPGPLPLL